MCRCVFKTQHPPLFVLPVCGCLLKPSTLSYFVLVVQDQPEQLRGELEALLSGAGISYSYSTKSKFANFINRTLE